MKKSIFDLELRIDINYEFKKMKDLLFFKDTIVCEGYYYTLYEFLNDEIFPLWKYKGIFIDFDDFCERLNIDFDSDSINEDEYLYLLELLLNLWVNAKKRINPNEREYCSAKVFGYFDNNLPLIIEKMNYQIIREGDKYKIIKRDSDVDSVLDFLSEDYITLLLDYNDIRNNNIESKKTILKKLDLIIEKNKKTYQSIDKDTYNSIQVIFNKMGVNHPIKEEPYISFGQDILIEWYDKCFKLIIHLIRNVEINKINDERKSFSGD